MHTKKLTHWIVSLGVKLRNTKSGNYFLTSLLSRAFSIAASFAMTLLLTRSLEISEVGKFFTVLAVLLGASTVGRFGTETLVLKWSATGTSNFIWMCKLLGISFLGSVIVGILISPILKSLLQNSVPDYQLVKLSAALALSVVLTGLSVFSSAIMRGRGHYAGGTFAELGSTYTFFVTASLIYSTFSQLTLVSSLFIYTISCAFTTIWTLTRSYVISSNIKFAHRAPSSRKIASSLASMMASSLSVYLNAWLPVIVLSIFAESSDVALFVVASRVAGFITLIPSIQVTYLATTFASLYKFSDKSGISLVARNASKVGILASLPILAIIFIAPEFVFTLFGETYPEAIFSAQILAASATLVVALGPVVVVMLNAGLERVTAIAGTISLLIASVAMFGGSFVSGLEGVSVAVLCVNFGTGAILFIWLYKNLGISTSWVIRPPRNHFSDPEESAGETK
jgi:O-antigen/teichoic acid export membrane protein